MEKAQLTVRKRGEVTKRTTKELRREGYIPATMFGRGLTSQSLGVPKREFLSLLKQHEGDCTGVLLELEIEGNGAPQTVLVRKTYRNPLSLEFDNIDLHVVRMDELVHLVVPVRTEGEPAGVKDGGILEHVRREVDVRCLPGNIPEHMHVNMSHVAIGGTVTVADLRPLPGVEILTPKDKLIAAVRPKPIAVAPTEVAAAPVEEAPEEEEAKGKEPAGES